MFRKYGFGLIAWSPLAGGILTGKYLESGKENQEGGEARFRNMSPAHATYKKMFYDPYVNPKNNAALKKLNEIA